MSLYHKIIYGLILGTLISCSSSEPQPGDSFGATMIRFYQQRISPIDGPRSSSYPTGSSYGIEAFNRYGFFIGFVVTASRLLHEYDEARLPLIQVHQYNRKNDPLDYNVYWWDESVIHARREKRQSAHSNHSP